MVEDGLASNGPHVRLLKELDMSFVLGVKGDHKALFAWVDELESAPQASASKPGVKRWETKDADGVEHCFRWSNGAPLKRRERGPGGELPRILGKEAERQGQALLVGHGVSR